MKARAARAAWSRRARPHQIVVVGNKAYKVRTEAEKELRWFASKPTTTVFVQRPSLVGASHPSCRPSGSVVRRLAGRWCMPGSLACIIAYCG